MKPGAYGMWRLDADGQRIERSAEKTPNGRDMNNARRVARRLKFEALCRRHGLKPETVRARTNPRKGGMSLREALRTPIMRGGRQKRSAEWSAQARGHWQEFGEAREAKDSS
ncbi:hypothetical protein FIU88_08030 [Halomonas sp. THAF12]|uniref:hypothetical protein n=1 Tax=Halomonas sp. THAF12 TaxID=2587849 RepID=UPI0012683695|nr:hypothetical protein [Halomonas sp. THAF12]QFT84921.1 hypothetical protein FIU88_08030 [Halomonas sp. THAF12]